MTITVRLFARARDLAGADVVTVDLPPEATVRELKRRLAHEQPQLGGIIEQSAVAVNDEFADEQTLLQPGAEVALLPPVSGG